MRIGIGLFLCLGIHAATTTLATIPNTGVNAVQVDSGGNIYLAGSQSGDAFVTKLSPDGSQVLYATKLGGSMSDFASRLAIDATGNAYLFGQTQSPDFPVTPGAAQTTLMATNGQGFAAKLDPKGNVVYATFLGGSQSINPSGGIAVDPAGDLYVSGQYVVFNVSPTPPQFVMKLGPTGNLAATMNTIGGPIALDAQGNLYVAG